MTGLFGSWKLEAGSWKLEAGSWKLEAGSWKMKHKRLLADVNLNSSSFQLTASGFRTAS
ncbi:hypothetical protein [Zobellella denitrificans]|uniref:hypothetical protein n=1 Tax=Zobellella denitrificans TaxID=347534 RepID=UPI0012FE19E9|nr:hypothetical protein [Zobellella denitrificans]